MTTQQPAIDPEQESPATQDRTEPPGFDEPREPAPHQSQEANQTGGFFREGLSATAIALLIMTIIAAGAIGYVIGISSAAVQPRQTQPTQASQSQPAYPPPGQAETSEGSRLEAHQFSATTMAGEEFDIGQTLGSPTLLVFWSHW